jgi:uncharacterized protein (DUF1800 family)
MTQDTREAAAEAARGRASTFAATTAVASAAAALSACGGSDDAGPDGADKSDADALRRRLGSGGPSVPTLPGQAPEEQAARFLAQAGLGPTLPEVQALARRTVSGRVDFNAWLDEQFAAPARSDQGATLQERTAFQLGLDLGLLTDTVRNPFVTGYGLDNVLWFRLMTGTDVLRQRTVLALSEIFVVSQRNMPIPWGQFATLAYWDLLERHAFGSFRQLLEAVTLSPAMGTYLSLRGSQQADASGRRPDENYARELLQLFTIGLDRLDDAGRPTGQPSHGPEDVTELARALTGWDFDLAGEVPRFDPSVSPAYTRRPMVANPAHHDSGAKSFLGAVLPAGGSAQDDLRRALDALAAHPNVAPFVSRQLIQRLVTSNPEPEHVMRVAQVFRSTGGRLSEVIRAVLTDPLAREPLPAAQAERRCKLREPLLRFVQFGRVAGVRSLDGRWEIGNLSGAGLLGQSPLQSPSVFNFFRPGYVPPNTVVAAAGLVAPEFQLTDESSVVSYANFMLRTLDGVAGAGIALSYADWLGMAADAPRLVDQLNLVLTGRALAASTVKLIEQAVTSLPASDPMQQRKRVLAAFYLMLTSPDYLVQR